MIEELWGVFLRLALIADFIIDVISI